MKVHNIYYDATSISESAKRRIRHIAKTKGVDEAMEYANKILEGYGVEDIFWTNSPWDFPAKPDYSYVNLGDPYVPTVIYNHLTKRFVWNMCWEDLAEKQEQRMGV